MTSQPQTEKIFIEERFSDHLAMLQSAVNWRLRCIYRLSLRGFSGIHRVALLPGMQLSYSDKRSPMLFHAQAPKDSVTIAAIADTDGYTFFKRLRLKPGILVSHDDAPYLFYNGGSSLSACISLDKTRHPDLAEKILRLQRHPLEDPQNSLYNVIVEAMERIRHVDGRASSDLLFQRIEDHLLKKLHALFTPSVLHRAASIHKSSSGEIAAFSTIEKFFSHMDGKFDSKELAALYGISPVTLQKGFRTLTGFTPQKFFRILKLNIVHSELVSTENEKYTVSQIANRWGFSHMGRFSGYYQELFGESPSETLSKKRPYNSIKSNCVTRREEITT